MRNRQSPSGTWSGDVVWAGEADASQGSSKVPGPEGTDMMTDGMPEVPRPVLCGVAGKGTN